MFESKKWLVWFFVLALVGSIGGSLIAYVVLQKKPQTNMAPVANVEPVKTTERAPEPKTNTEKTKADPTETTVFEVDETAKPDFKIMSRSEWKAHAAVSELKPHKPKIISLHHTATTPFPDKSLASKMRSLQDFSQHTGKIGSKAKAAWPDVPYHFYIDVNGDVAEGRDINFVGDTNTDYDATGQIVIALEGNFEKGEPTKIQMDVLFKMVKWLSTKYKIPSEKINTHKAFASTACPGKNLENRLHDVRQYAWKR